MEDHLAADESPRPENSSVTLEATEEGPRMSSLVGVTKQGTIAPYAIYNGPRTGDAFLEWNMGSLAWVSRGSNRGMGDIHYVDPPEQLDVLYGLANYYNMGQVSQLFSAAQSAFGSAVASIEFRSQVSPPIVINQPFATPAAGQPAQAPQGADPVTAIVMAQAKPAVYIHLTDGTTYPIEPYGTPSADYTGYVIMGAGLTVGLGILVGVTIGKKLFCR